MISQAKVKVKRKKTSDHKHKRSSRLHKSVQYQIELEEVQELPCDVDGKCVYTLYFDPRYRMKSTKNGRPWKSWDYVYQKPFWWDAKKSMMQ